MVFKKGEVNNPKGSPIIREISKKATGPRTTQGKINGVIKRNMIRSGKFMRKIKRECNDCGLKTVQIEGKDVVKCFSYKPNERCPLSVSSWEQKMRALIMSKELEADEMLKIFAAEAYSNSLKSQQFESITEGQPSGNTNMHLRTAMDGADKAGRLQAEHKKIDQGLTDGTQNVNYFDMSKLIDKANKEDWKEQDFETDTSFKKPEEEMSEEIKGDGDVPSPSLDLEKNEIKNKQLQDSSV